MAHQSLCRMIRNDPLKISNSLKKAENGPLGKISSQSLILPFPRIPTGIYVYYVFQCINLFQNGQFLLLLWHNNELVYPPEFSRIAGFCTNFLKKILGGPPDPPFKQNCLSLYYNHNTANHLKKLRTHTQISPPPHHFSGELKIKWSLYVLFEKSIVDHFFANVYLKEQRKVLENSLKM